VSALPIPGEVNDTAGTAAGRLNRLEGVAGRRLKGLEGTAAGRLAELEDANPRSATLFALGGNGGAGGGVFSDLEKACVEAKRGPASRSRRFLPFLVVTSALVVPSAKLPSSCALARSWMFFALSVLMSENTTGSVSTTKSKASEMLTGAVLSGLPGRSDADWLSGALAALAAAAGMAATFKGPTGSAAGTGFGGGSGGCAAGFRRTLSSRAMTETSSDGFQPDIPSFQTCTVLPGSTAKII